MNLLLTHLSFSHFIELLKADTDTKRRFYEVQAINNNWGVRDLKRAIESLLFERTRLSNVKEIPLQKFNEQVELLPENVFKNTYLLEFLGLEDKAGYSESDLEESIITHLQNFLLELGRGFCFEARQKRITFDNTHYRIDLVFYHRILKTHILLDLKIGDFDHADAGQMNMYLNYYKENEGHTGDNSPIGIILCSGKNEANNFAGRWLLPEEFLKDIPDTITEKDIRIIARAYETHPAIVLSRLQHKKLVPYSFGNTMKLKVVLNDLLANPNINLKT